VVIWHAFFTSTKEIQAKKNNNTTCAAYLQTFSSETSGGKIAEELANLGYLENRQ